MIKFHSTLHLPSQGFKVQVYELNTEQYINLQKAIQNNDDDVITTCFESLIAECVILPKKVQLSCLDKFILLLFLRSISVDSIVELPFEAKQVLKFNISTFLNSILNANLPLTQCIRQGSMSIQLGIPARFTYADQLEYAHASIYSVTANHETIWTVDLTEEERQSVLNTLPANLIPQLETYIADVDLHLSKIEIPLLSTIQEGLQLSTKTGILLELLKILWRSNLMEVYEKNYFLTSKAHLSIADIYKMSPAEVSIYYNLMVREAEETSKKLADKTPGVNLGTAAPNVEQ